MQLVIEPCLPSIFPLWTESKSSSSSSSSSRPLLGQITALELVNTVSDLKVTTLDHGSIVNFTEMSLTSPSLAFEPWSMGVTFSRSNLGSTVDPITRLKAWNPIFSVAIVAGMPSSVAGWKMALPVSGPNAAAGYGRTCVSAVVGDVVDRAQDEIKFIKFFYNGKEHDEFGLPRWLDGDSYQGAYIVPVSWCGNRSHGLRHALKRSTRS
jgi:hypothetical protein